LEILQTHTQKLPLADCVDLAAIARDADGFSGADLAGLVREAAMLAIRTCKPVAASPDGDQAASTTGFEEVKVTAELFTKARSRVSASVSKKEREEYKALAMRIASGRQDAVDGSSKAKAV